MQASAKARDVEMEDEEVAAGSQDEADMAEEGFDWPAEREARLDLLTRCLAIDFRKLWQIGVPEEVSEPV